MFWLTQWRACRSAWSTLLHVYQSRALRCLSPRCAVLICCRGHERHYSPTAATQSPRLTQLEVENVLAQRKAGHSIEMIASTLGRTRAAVDSMLSRHVHTPVKLRLQEKPRGRSRWSQQEIDDLIAQASAGRTKEAMASSMGRSLSSIQKKLHALRCSTHSRLGMDPTRYSPEDDQRIVDLWSRGYQLAQISANLSRRRSQGSITSRLMKLGSLTGYSSQRKREKSGRPWTEVEMENLRRYVVDEKLTWKEICALMPQRSYAALQAAARQHGFQRHKQHGVPWSARELSILSKLMKTDASRRPSVLEIRTLFPDREISVVLSRWKKALYTKRAGVEMKGRSSLWTGEEDNLLRELDAKGTPLKDIQARLQHRSATAVQVRAYLLRKRGFSGRNER